MQYVYHPQVVTFNRPPMNVHAFAHDVEHTLGWHEGVQENGMVHMCTAQEHNHVLIRVNRLALIELKRQVEAQPDPRNGDHLFWVSGRALEDLPGEALTRLTDARWSKA